jgi:hypothetical protein
MHLDVGLTVGETPHQRQRRMNGLGKEVGFLFLKFQVTRGSQVFVSRVQAKLEVFRSIGFLY